MENKIRILHVDDNQFDRTLIRDALLVEHDRFEILEADNREKFEQHLAGQDFDLVLSDFNILGFDGLQVLQLVKEKYPDMPVIIVTGTGSEEIAIQAMKMGADDYVIKTVKHIRGLVSAIEMVLENKKNRDELRESEKRYHSLFENMVEGFAYCKMLYEKGQPQDFIYLEVNQSFETLTGLRNVTWRKVSEVIPGVRNADPDLFEAFSRVALTGTPERFEFFVKALKMWFDISVYSPEKEYFVAVFDVITERKLAEESMKNYGLHLEETVKQRTIDLEAAKERAESADRLKSAFLSTTSHELRTPLNSIIGFSGILLRETIGPLNEEQKKQLGIVQSNGRRLLSLINDILDLSKIEAEVMTVNNESFDIQKDIDEILTMVDQSAKSKGLTLRFNKTPGLTEIISDKQRVHQVLLNLVNNAIKFTEHGSVSIECFENNNSINVEVIDTGIGIREENLSKIFNPFIQIDNDYNRKLEGTGLGLSISKKLIELLHGTINVKSEFGIGSTFTITLPVKNNK